MLKNLAPSSTTTLRLMGEELADIFKRLKFQSVLARIEQKHRGLLANLSLKANIGFYHKRRAMRGQARRQHFPVIPLEHHAKMRYRDVMSIDRIGMGVLLAGGFRMFVDDQLMAEKIKIHPLLAAAAFFTTKNLAIKMAGGGNVIDR